MKKLTMIAIMATLLVGAELAAQRVDRTKPSPLVWDTQFTQDKALQISGLGRDLDVVFAGSSVAQSNLDPDIFIQASESIDSAYNAGIPAVTPQVWRQFLLDTVYRETCPRVVVIAVDIRQFNDNKPGADNQLWRYLGSLGRLREIGESNLWQDAEEWLRSKSALFRVRARLREPDKVVAWVLHIGEKGDWRYTNLSPLGRYRSNDDRTYETTQEKIDSLATGAFADFSVGGTETESIRLMIEDARSRGAIPVLVEMPAMNQDMVVALPNGHEDLTAYTAALRSVAQETGTDFIRLPEFDDDPIYYSDLYHMNFTGTKAVTRALAARIDALDLDFRSGGCSATN